MVDTGTIIEEDVVTITYIQPAPDALRATCYLNGQPHQMLVDTGAARTLVSETTWKTIGRPQIQTTRLRLVTYTGEQIKLLGQTKLQIRYRGETRTTMVVVTAGDRQNVLGRDLMKQLLPELYDICAPVMDKSEPKLTKPKKLQEVLDRHKALFGPDFGKIRKVKAHIKLKEGAQPKFCHARPLAFAKKQKVTDELNRLEALGIISKVNYSKWASPAVPVTKPSGAMRLCGDYKVSLNKQIEVDSYPLPRPEELFAQLAGGKTFTKIDLSEAYLQVEVDEATRELLTINTHQGLYQYNRLPFGVASAPAIFQRTMEQITSGLPGVGVYLDDIIVTGRDEAEHLRNLDDLLQRLEEFGVRVKVAKCSFMSPEINYLGHILNASGRRPNQDKVKAINDMPAPSDVAEVRSFLGMIRYYDKFVPGLSSAVKPINELLKQNVSWSWGKQQQQAMDFVKAKLTSPETLTHFDPNLPIVLATDASPVGVGAVIYHELPDGTVKPIEYTSKTLSPAEMNYAQIDKEALSIIYGVKKFHLYLHGRRFKLVTDHKPLLFIFSPDKQIPQMAASRLQRWAIILASYEFDIVYQPTDEHGNADGLSRMPVGRDLPFEQLKTLHQTVSTIQDEQIQRLPVTADTVREETQKDPLLKRVFEYTQNGWPNQVADNIKSYGRRRLELTTHNGCLLWGERVVVPTACRHQVLQQIHEAHPGMARMKGLARAYCYWPGLDEQIEKTTKTCSTCAQASPDADKQQLRQWTTPEKPWERIHLDFAGPFAGSMWLLLVDALTCWPEAKRLRAATTATTTEALREIFATHGLPEVVVTDNGTPFTSADFEEFCNQRGIRHICTPPYHPQSNGLVERFVRTFKMAIKKAGAVGTGAEKATTTFLARYRVMPHPTTGRAPCELLMGRRLRTTLDLLFPHRAKVEREKNRQQEAFNRGRRTRKQHDVGDAVWIKNTRVDGNRWLRGVVAEKLGNVLVKVRQEEGGPLLRRHLNQLRVRADEVTPTTTAAATLRTTSAERPAHEEPQTTTTAPTTPYSTPLAQRRGRRAPKAPSRYISES